MVDVLFICLVRLNMNKELKGFLSFQVRVRAVVVAMPLEILSLNAKSMNSYFND